MLQALRSSGRLTSLRSTPRRFLLLDVSSEGALGSIRGLSFARRGCFAGCLGGPRVDHPGGDVLDRGAFRSGGCEGLGGLVSRVTGDLFLQLGGLGFGEETLFLEAGFAAAFVAVPEDEEEDWDVRVGLV